MGLGVFLARSVVERLSGQLSIESDSDTGTSVFIALPFTISNETAAAQ